MTKLKYFVSMDIIIFIMMKLIYFIMNELYLYNGGILYSAWAEHFIILELNNYFKYFITTELSTFYYNRAKHSIVRQS